MTLPLDQPIQVSNPEKNYGFVIDNRKCIGCHACSVACKAENEVPLSVNRTWVKYVETGLYPDTRRHFQVTRCNHCANPPCTRICPTEAMYQRADGIVEFDSSVCIGCKACMQACPYDAIYIDPESHTAAKCHYCAHRTDIGLEPACVVVCPEHAIISGDMNDPTTEISNLLATQDVTVRKPEQGTAPKLFYIDGNDVVMHPTATERSPETFMWADVIPLDDIPITGSGSSHTAQPPSPTASPHSNGARLRSSQPQGQPWNGPIAFGEGRMAEHMVQVAYNAQHKVPWHWPVPAYLVTKGISAGVFGLYTIGLGFGLFENHPLTAMLSGLITVIFLLATTGLLVYDLEKPERFLYILLRPQWRSWLTRGAVVLIGFSTISGLWWLTETLAYFGAISGGVADASRPFFLWLGFPFAVMTAIYTAFLFAQAEGRDLWQSPLLPAHLTVQAMMMGGAILSLLALITPMPADIAFAAQVTFLLGLVLDLFIIFTGEFGIPHASEVAARAAHDITHGKYKSYFWNNSMIVGHLAAGAFVLATIIGGNPLFGALGAICAVYGLYWYEYAFVMAPQDIPNS